MSTILTAPAPRIAVTYGVDESCPQFTTVAYQRMVTVGNFVGEDKVELLENYLVLSSPGNPAHDGTIQCIAKRLGRRLPTSWDIRPQFTVSLADSQPEPDLAVARGDEVTYLTRHPAADVGLVIEVADSSLLRDQRDKTRIYARASIPTYWIVNLVDRRIEVFTNPTGPADVPQYQAFATFQPGDVVPLSLDGTALASIAAADLLP